MVRASVVVLMIGCYRQGVEYMFEKVVQMLESEGTVDVTVDQLFREGGKEAVISAVVGLMLAA